MTVNYARKIVEVGDSLARTRRALELAQELNAERCCHRSVLPNASNWDALLMEGMGLRTVEWQEEQKRHIIKMLEEREAAQVEQLRSMGVEDA